MTNHNSASRRLRAIFGECISDVRVSGGTIRVVFSDGDPRYFLTWESPVLGLDFALLGVPLWHVKRTLEDVREQLASSDESE